MTENQIATILWDMPVQTDKEIKVSRPDIVVKGKKEKNLSAYRYIYPQRMKQPLEKSGKTHKVLLLSREEQKTLSARSQAISE